ncbi:DUF3343 domain-containing protein [Clostridium sp. D2Q-14]|uniref:DUF3343 domain-containing protein n=1 Tax=Anaeromonas gelatinilytica TaxID=2683194 RepID=UPI00193B93A0|nr:DUF3343 domain-containing protein [Anaeromonas gelatinilytica]MBS4534406.1 DUF3343 domain-containing protein [Anaeromonas gelatinilytica]
MLNKEIYVITFDSTHHAIEAEKKIKDENIDIKTIPTPREVSVSCGLSIKFDYIDLNRIKSIIEDNNLSISNIYIITREDNERIAKKLM